MSVEEARSSYGVGFGKVDITPPLPFPLAGIVTPGGRKARWVHDPLYARAAVFSDKTRRVAIASVDLLTIHVAFREAVEQRIAAAGVVIDALLLTATHTHSSAGAYWDKPTSELFVGTFRQEAFDALADGVARAVIDAVHDLRSATLSYGETEAPGLSWNRRHPNGPVDRHLTVLLVDRDDGRHRIVSFGAHPVIAAFRETDVASADYPGALLATLEKDGAISLFVNGAVGGVNVVFPEPVRALDDHLALVHDALLVRVQAAEEAATPVAAGGVAGTTVTRQLQSRLPRLFPSRWWAADVAAAPIRSLWRHFFIERGVGKAPFAPVTAIRVGDVLFAGFPGDTGPSVTLEARRMTEATGLRFAVGASHAGGFVGYVHMPDDYEMPPVRGEDYAHMTIYENAMGGCGRTVGVSFIQQLGEALTQV